MSTCCWILIGLVLLWAWQTGRLEGMTPGQYMLQPNPNSQGRGQLRETTVNAGFYPMYDIQCHGDATVGNTVEWLNPTPDYGSNAINNAFGYVFRFKDDAITKGVYGTPQAAMRSYCSNPERVINGIPS